MKKTKSYNFHNGLIATTRMTGQSDRAVNDLVNVEVTLYIPTEKNKNGIIAKKLQWGKRVEIFNEFLIYNWGFPSKQGKKRTKTFQGTRYSNLFKEAEKYILAEIEKITTAEATRKKALKDAEK